MISTLKRVSLRGGLGRGLIIKNKSKKPFGNQVKLISKGLWYICVKQIIKSNKV